MQSLSAALVGAVFNGKWKLVRVIGEGGMGAVFEAHGTRGEGVRALKVLHTEHLHEPSIVDRFFAEAAAIQQLAHPNLPEIYDQARAEDGTPYLVMELLRGEPLSKALAGGKKLNPHRACSIALGMLQALNVAHATGIVHRDLKPDNVFLVEGEGGKSTVKVLDFGIAKIIDGAGGAGSKTKTGMLLGTPGYMSPEQVKDSKHVDLRTDLWAVSVLLYEMLAGRRAFDAPNELARLTMVLTESAPPMGERAPELASWNPFFERALARDIEKRFQSAGEMAQAIVRQLDRTAPTPGPARTPTPAQPRAAATQHSAVPASPDGRDAPAPGKTLVAAGFVVEEPVAAVPAPRELSVPADLPAPLQALASGGSGPSGTLATMGTALPAPVAAQRTLPGGSGGPGIDVLDAPRIGLPWWGTVVVGALGLIVGFVLGRMSAP
jgi:serine/threonine protein kinase